eukprot:15183-Heterococcus_DN1.PRE.1
MEQIHALLLGAVCIAAAFVFWLRKRSQTDDDDDIEQCGQICAKLLAWLSAAASSTLRCADATVSRSSSSTNYGTAEMAATHASLTTAVAEVAAANCIQKRCTSTTTYKMVYLSAHNVMYSSMCSGDGQRGSVVCATAATATALSSRYREILRQALHTT